MARKARYFKIGNKTYTADDWGDEFLAAAIRDAKTEAIQSVAVLAADLQKVVDDLNKGSTNRGIGRTRREDGSSINEPMEFAQVVVDVVKDTDTHVEFNVYVRDRVFNLLDEGRPDREVGPNNELFPIYDGHLTKPDSVDVNVGGVNVSSRFYVARAGSVIKGFPGRRFFVTIANKRRYVKEKAKQPTGQDKDFAEYIQGLINIPKSIWGAFRFDPSVSVRTEKRSASRNE